MYRGRKSTETTCTTGSKKAKKGTKQEKEPQTVMFVDYTIDGELASSMKDLAKRLYSVTDFTVKVVERAGTSLKEQFPTTTFWMRKEGLHNLQPGS